MRSAAHGSSPGSPPVVAGGSGTAPDRSADRSREAGAPATPIATLLRDLGPRLRRGAWVATDPDAAGPRGLDALLAGRPPPGRIVEITGPPSSGRTSVALGWLAAATRRGEVAAVVDGADALDPLSARAAGVDLTRVLWVRAPGWRPALRAAERLVEARGFGLVWLDLDRAEEEAAADAGRPPTSAWLRLSRAASRTRTPLVVLGSRRRAGTFSDLVLETRPAGARFSPAPALLEGLDVRVTLARSRLGPDDETMALALRIP